VNLSIHTALTVQPFILTRANVQKAQDLFGECRSTIALPQPTCDADA
jgi:hypothetical protein